MLDDWKVSFWPKLTKGIRKREISLSLQSLWFSDLQIAKKNECDELESSNPIIRILGLGCPFGIKLNSQTKFISSVWPLKSTWFATRRDPCTRPGNSFANWPIATRTICTLHAPFSKNQTITFTQINQRYEMSFLTDLIESAFPVAYAEEVCLPWKENGRFFGERYSHLRWQVKTPSASKNQSKRGNKELQAGKSDQEQAVFLVFV